METQKNSLLSIFFYFFLYTINIKTSEQNTNLKDICDKTISEIKEECRTNRKEYYIEHFTTMHKYIDPHENNMLLKDAINKLNQLSIQKIVNLKFQFHHLKPEADNKLFNETIIDFLYKEARDIKKNNNTLTNIPQSIDQTKYTNLILLCQEPNMYHKKIKKYNYIASHYRNTLFENINKLDTMAQINLYAIRGYIPMIEYTFNIDINQLEENLSLFFEDIDNNIFINSYRKKQNINDNILIKSYPKKQNIIEKHLDFFIKNYEEAGLIKKKSENNDYPLYQIINNEKITSYFKDKIIKVIKYTVRRYNDNTLFKYFIKTQRIAKNDNGDIIISQAEINTYLKNDERLALSNLIDIKNQEKNRGDLWTYLKDIEISKEKSIQKTNRNLKYFLYFLLCMTATGLFTLKFFPENIYCKNILAYLNIYYSMFL